MERNKLNPERIELAERVHKLAQAAGEAVVAIDHYGVDLAPAAIGQEPVKLRPALFRSAHAHIHIFAYDLPTAPLAIGVELGKLHLRVLLSLTYRLAIRAGRVKENPARLVQHKTENNGRVRFLTPKEEENLRKVIREKFPEHEPELDLALHAGLRQGEQYNAHWADADFERRVFTVPLDKGGKTSHVPLNAAAVRALAELHRLHGGTEFVCGGARSPRAWFEAAVKAAKIEGFTWHCLRHTFASRLVMSGADLRTVAELLRDKTLAMVMRYAHLAPDYKLAAVERMASSFAHQTDTSAGKQVAVGTGMVQ